MDAVLRDRLSMIAALGAGVVVGISGIYMYYKVNRTVTRELSQLTGTIENLRREIEELKRHNPPGVHTASPLEKKHHPQAAPSASGCAAQQNSSSLDEEDDDEFFDFTDVDEKSTSNGTGSEEDDMSFDLSTWLEGVDALLDGSTRERENSYLTLKAREEQLSDNPDFLWRLSKSTHLHRLLVQKSCDPKLKKDLAYQAHDSAKLALKLSKNHPEVHKWFAITLGALGEFVSLQDKIQNGFIFKEHVDIAIKLKPEDPTLHHLMGRWCYEVSILSWLERRICSSLLAAPPESTLTEARRHLIQADQLNPRWKENLLYIAKCFISEGEYADAMDWVERAFAITPKTEDDQLAHDELELLQNKYKSYRS